jgi:hypothetical protein
VTRRIVVFGNDANGYHGGMLNKRKAAIGYATYVVGTRVAKRAVRRKANAMMSTARERSRPARRRRRMIPLVGGAAAAIAGATVIARRHHGADGED